MTTRFSSSIHRRRLASLAAQTGLALFVGGLVFGCDVQAGAGGSLGSNTYYLSPAGSDANPCTQPLPCRSFNRGYHVAQLGDTVELAAGDYGIQYIEPPSKAAVGPEVVFRPAPGASVTTGTLNIVSVNHIEIRGLSTGQSAVNIVSDSLGNNPSEDITLRDVTTLAWFIRSSNHVSILRGDSGYSDRAVSDTIGAFGTTPSRDVVVDGTTIHDQQRTAAPSVHPDGIFVQSVDGLIIRNTRFFNDDVLPLYFSRILAAPTSRNILVENNVIDTPNPEGWYPIQFTWAGGPNDQPYENVIFRFNSLGGPMNLPKLNGWCVPGTCSVTGNTGPMPAAFCNPDVDYAYNVWAGARCGPTDKSVSNLGFAGGTPTAAASPFDYMLRGVSPQVDAVPQNVPAPSTDIRGTPRPQAAARDAGAYQWDPPVLQAGVAIGEVRLGSSRSAITAFYGAPERTRARRMGKQTSIDTYRVHGGHLWVVYAGTTVAGVGTDTPYYRDAAGNGVTPTMERAPHAFLWNRCLSRYQRDTQGVSTWFSVGAKGRRVTEAWVMRRAVAGTVNCAGAPKGRRAP